MAVVDATTVDLDSMGMATITAMADGNQTVPAGYEVAFVLTSGTNLVIEDFNTTGTFTVTMMGDYQVHVLVAELDDTDSPNFVDLSVIMPGMTTGADVLTLFGNAGICAALQVPGTAVTVTDSNNTGGGGGTCTAEAGMATVDATTVDLDSMGMATITAMADGNQTVPAGYEVAFVLTSGTNLVIEDFNTTGTFTVTMMGDYQVHVLVAELDDTDSPNFVDLSVIMPGMTTGADVLTLFGNAGICAALQVPGTAVTVTDSNNTGGGGGSCTAAAGMATVDAASVELDSMGMATITAMADGNQVVPMDYEVAFVLTMGMDLTIMDFNTTGSFDVNVAGDYQVHVFVAEITDPTSPNFVDLSVVMPGMTTGADVLNLLSSAGICAALQVPGTAVTVTEEEDLISGIPAALTTALRVNVFPNPSADQINIQLDRLMEDDQQVVIRLLDESGRIVRTERLGTDAQLRGFRMDISSLASGTYYLQAVNGNQVSTQTVHKF